MIEQNAKITYLGTTTETNMTKGEAVADLSKDGWNIVSIDGNMGVTLLARNNEMVMVF